MLRNVCNVTVLNGLCCGCGVCVGICPNQSLHIKFNSHGEYNPVLVNENCIEKCDLCLRVCPFSNESHKEDVISSKIWANKTEWERHEVIGYYNKCYCGYVTNERTRLNSSSGGLLTWILQELLRENEVDYIICVTRSKQGDKLFEFTLCHTIEEIGKCSRSCYYPVEISTILHHINGHGGKYAITGLPCVIKALRFACQYREVLNSRIKYLLGLVCGQQQSSFFVDYICSLGGGNPNELSHVEFRIKNQDRPASDYGLTFLCKNGYKKTVYWTEGMKEAWCNRYFTLNACNFCDDIFAELADASFMDAWLPQFSKDYRGTSIMIARNKRLKDLIESGGRNLNLKVNEIDVKSVVSSQRGSLKIKREYIAKRLDWAQRTKKLFINKRVMPKKTNLLQRHIFNIEDKLCQTSKRAFQLQKNTCNGLHVYNKKMKGILFKKRIIQRVSKLFGALI